MNKMQTPAGSLWRCLGAMLALLVLVAGCARHSEEAPPPEVTEWLMSWPTSDRYNAGYHSSSYPTEDEWVAAGSKIENLEPILTGLMKHNTTKAPDYVIAMALEHFGTQASVDVLSDAVARYDNDPRIRSHAVRALARAGGPSALDLLETVLLFDDSTEVKESTRDAILSMKDERAVHVMESELWRISEVERNLDASIKALKLELHKDSVDKADKP